MHTLLFKVESHEFKPFKDAAEDYANKWQHQVENRILIIALFRHLQRRPNNSIGCLEETKLRGKGETKATDVLQVSTVVLTIQSYFEKKRFRKSSRKTFQLFFSGCGKPVHQLLQTARDTKLCCLWLVLPLQVLLNYHCLLPLRLFLAYVSRIEILDTIDEISNLMMSNESRSQQTMPILYKWKWTMKKGDVVHSWTPTFPAPTTRRSLPSNMRWTMLMATPLSTSTTQGPFCHFQFDGW